MNKIKRGICYVEIIIIIILYSSVWLYYIIIIEKVKRFGSRERIYDVVHIKETGKGRNERVEEIRIIISGTLTEKEERSSRCPTIRGQSNIINISLFFAPTESVFFSINNKHIFLYV